MEAIIELLKPSNEESIANLSEAFNKELKLVLGGLNQLSFSLPFDRELHHRLKRNYNIDKIMKRYLLKLKNGDRVEKYIITNIKDSADDNSDTKHIEAISLGYELRDKKIYGLKEEDLVSKNGVDILKIALNNTIWTVGYVNQTYKDKYRSFDVPNNSVLDFLYQIAETFDAVLDFDTMKRQINLYHPDEIGEDKGLFFRYGKYLQSLEINESDALVTRLYIYGKNGISIEKYNPTGLPYLDNYSSVIYPFERDENRNVIKSSFWLSDDLCHALLDYQIKLNQNRGTFGNLLDQLESLNKVLDMKNNYLSSSKIELDNIKTSLELYALTNGHPTQSQLDEKTAKETLVENQESEIRQLNEKINGIYTQINSLKTELSTEQNFTSSQLFQLSKFMIEDEWRDENFDDEKELFKEGVKRLEELSNPLPEINIGIVNLKEIADEYDSWDKLDLGEIATIDYDKFNKSYKAKITEMTYNFESGDVNIVISPIKNLNNKKNWVMKKLDYSYGNAMSVANNKSKWNSIDSVKSSVDTIMSEPWNAVKNAIVAGTNESVEIGNRGIIIRNPNEENKYLIANHGVLAITNDGGQTFKNAITNFGVVAEKLYGQIIIGEQLQIANEKGSVSIDGSGINIVNGAINIVGGLPKEQLDPVYTDSVDKDIKEANDSILKLETNVTSIFSDGSLTSIEANTLKNSLSQVQSESNDLIAVAASLSITTEKDSYQVALNDLSAYLTANFINQPEYPIAITTTQRNDIESKFNLVQDMKSKLINKITQVREQRAVDASVGLGKLYNGVKIDSTEGLVVTRSDNKVKSIFNSTTGIKIQRHNGTSWADQFYADSNGNLTLTGNITMTGGSISWTNVAPPTASQVGALPSGTTASQIGGEKAITKSSTAPTSPTTGQLWVDTTSIPYVWKQWNGTSWVKASPTNASEIGAVANSQTDVFNALTNNGTMRGLFMNNGELYMNADYINSGTITGVTIQTSTNVNNQMKLSGNGLVSKMNSLRTELSVVDIYKDGSFLIPAIQFFDELRNSYTSDSALYYLRHSDTDRRLTLATTAKILLSASGDINLNSSLGSVKIESDTVDNSKLLIVGGSTLIEGGMYIKASLNLINATTSTSAMTGSNGYTLPSSPYGFLTVYIDGNARKIPYYG